MSEDAALILVDADTLLVRQTVLGALNWSAQWYRPQGRLGVQELARRMFVLLFPLAADRAACLSDSKPMEVK